MGKITPEAERRRGGVGAAWTSAGPRQAPRKEEEVLGRGRAAPWMWCRCPPTSPLFIGARGGLHTHLQGAAPPLPNTSPPPQELGEALPEYCHYITTTSSCCCWSPLPQPLPPPFCIKARETSPGYTCVERGGAVVRRLDPSPPRSESLQVRLLPPRSCNASVSRSSRV